MTDSPAPRTRSVRTLGSFEVGRGCPAAATRAQPSLPTANPPTHPPLGPPMSAIKDFRANFGQALQPVLAEAASSREISPGRMGELVEGVMDKVGRVEEGEAQWRTEVRRTTVDRTLEDIIISVVSLGWDEGGWWWVWCGVLIFGWNWL